MRTGWLIFLLLLTSLFVFAQSKPVQGPAPMTPPSEAPAQQIPTVPSTPEQGVSQPLPESTPVITINGLCEKTTPPVSDCRTQITKQQFEAMLNAVMPTGAGTPPMPPVIKRERANQFAQLLTVASAAEKNGIDKTPEGQQLIKIARMQALAQAYVRQLQQKSKPSDADVQAYYNANASKYDQATFNQLFIPRSKGADGKPADEAADKARAEQFRERAAAGEPFDKLQKEAIEGTNFQAPPPTEVVLQKENLPTARQQIFTLKPGEVSPVITESSGSLVYKLVSKSQVPFAQVKANIEQRLTQEKFQSAVDAVVKSTTPVLNDAYFGGPGRQATPGAGIAPPAQPPTPATGQPAATPAKPKTPAKK